MKNKALQQNILQGVAVAVFVAGMVWFGIWYFRASMGEMPQVADVRLSAEKKSAAPTSAGAVATATVVSGNGRLESESCGIAMNIPASWREQGRAVPLFGVPLDAVVMDEPYRQSRRVVFWFACFDADAHELSDLIGKDVGSSALQAVDEKTVDGVTFKRTPSFWYATHKGKHFFVHVNFTRYDAAPHAEYERVMMNILESVEFHS